MTVDVERSTGQIVQDGIRYVLMRPDVLMGVARELRGLPTQAFLGALEESAFRHGQASFAQYQSTGVRDGSGFMARVFEAAARLGWGIWTSTENVDGSVIVEVRNSPFAAGFGSSSIPVCAPIAGILRAADLAAHGRRNPVMELSCAAQGAAACRFELSGRNA